MTDLAKMWKDYSNLKLLITVFKLYLDNLPAGYHIIMIVLVGIRIDYDDSHIHVVSNTRQLIIWDTSVCLSETSMKGWLELILLSLL